MLSQVINPLLAIVFAAVAAMGAPVNTWRPAAAGSLAVYLYCGSQGSGGFVCVADPEGGSAPLTFTWTTITNATVNNQFDSTDTSVIQGSCQVGSSSSVNVSVKDTTGATVTTTRTFNCTSGGLPALPPLPPLPPLP